MDNKGVTMMIKELKRAQVLQEVVARRMTGQDEAQMLGLSVRQVRRLQKTFREKGAEGLVHGNRGKQSQRRMPEEERERIIKLLGKDYRDYNTRHLAEELEWESGIVISYSALRQLRNAAGLPSPRKRRALAHRSRRERRLMAGMMLQANGNDHDWLEGRGPRLCLLAYIDYATNEVPDAIFREQEDSAGYILALDADRHKIFQAEQGPTLEQQSAGKELVSQFGWVLDELQVAYIPAYSAQAKGRVERLFETFQDRLVKELRKASACTTEDANRVLADFLPRFNQQFAKEAAQPGSAYRPWPVEVRPSDVFCFKYARGVRNDNTIAFDNHSLQIPPGPHRRSYARARVEVRLHLDGSRAGHLTPTLLPAPEPMTPPSDFRALTSSPTCALQAPPDHP